MGFNFQKLPVNTLIGADWKTFHEVTAGRKIDKGYKTKYHLTKALCRILTLTNGIENRRYNKRLPGIHSRSLAQWDNFCPQRTFTR